MRWATVMVTMALLVLGGAVRDGRKPRHAPGDDDVLGRHRTLVRADRRGAAGGNFSVSAHRTEVDFRQGNTNVSFWPITAGFGLGRAEIFGSLRVITRIDRDTPPLLFAGPDNEAGGLVNEFPDGARDLDGQPARRPLPRRQVEPAVAAAAAAAGAGGARHAQAADRRQGRRRGHRRVRRLRRRHRQRRVRRRRARRLRRHGAARRSRRHQHLRRLALGRRRRRSRRGAACARPRRCYGEWMFDDAVDGAGRPASSAPTARCRRPRRGSTDEVNDRRRPHLAASERRAARRRLNYRFGLEQTDAASGRPAEQPAATPSAWSSGSASIAA